MCIKDCVCAYVRVRVRACSVVERRLGGENSRAERYRESELSVGSQWQSTPCDLKGKQGLLVPSFYRMNLRKRVLIHNKSPTDFYWSCHHYACLKKKHISLFPERACRWGHHSPAPTSAVRANYSQSPWNLHAFCWIKVPRPSATPIVTSTNVTDPQVRPFEWDPYYLHISPSIFTFGLVWYNTMYSSSTGYLNNFIAGLKG